MLGKRESLWSHFPSRWLAEKYNIDGRSLPWKLVQIALLVCFSLGSYVVASQYVWKSVQIVGSSMEPTLREGQVLVLNRLVYYFREPRRGEMVVFKDPEDSRLSIKRIVAVPGDRLSIHDGGVFVNSHHLHEKYLRAGMQTMPTFGGDKVTETIVPDGTYYVLGDNRTNSVDSRLYGAISERRIMGMVWF